MKKTEEQAVLHTHASTLDQKLEVTNKKSLAEHSLTHCVEHTCKIKRKLSASSCYCGSFSASARSLVPGVTALSARAL